MPHRKYITKRTKKLLSMCKTFYLNVGLTFMFDSLAKYRNQLEVTAKEWSHTGLSVAAHT